MTNFLHAKYDSSGNQIDDPTVVIGQPEFAVDSTGAVTGLVVPGVKKLGLAGYKPLTNDLSGVIGALNAAIVSPSSRNVIFDDAVYDLGSGYVPIVSGIGYIGESVRFAYQNGGWTDAQPVPVGGSIFKSTAAAVFWDGAETLAAVTASVTAQNATLTVGSTDIVVTNGALFTLGGRVYTAASACGFYTGIGYYVVHKSGNTIRLGLPDGVGTTYSAFAPIAATASDTQAGFISAGRPNDCCTGVTMQNLVGLGVNTMVKAGARNTFSFVYSKLSHIYATGVVANRGTTTASRLMDVVNFAQSDFDNIHTYDGDGQYWGADYPQAAFLPGNSKFSHIFDASNGNTVGGTGSGGQCLVNRGIVFQAESDSILNEIHADTLQNNRGITNVGRTAQTDAAASINGTTSLTVTNGALWRVGLPFVFTTIAGSSNIYANVVYYVTSVNANILTFSERKGDTNITPSGTGTVSINTWGFPAIEIGGVGTNPQIACSSFTGMDIEGHSSAPLHLQYVYKSDINPVQCGGVIARQVATTTVRCPDEPLTDFDGACSILYLGARGVATTSPNWKTYTGAGITRWKDATAGHSQDVWSLSLHDGKYVTGQWLTPRQRGLEGVNYGSHAHIRTNVPIAPVQYQLDATATLNNTVYVGCLVFNGAAGQTFTLPTIFDIDVTRTHVGYTFEIMNASGNSLALATDGSQLINNVGAKTTTTIAARTKAIITASKATGPVLFWSVQLLTAAP